MDNLTHTLTGLALSHAGLNRKTRFATLVLVVGSSLPDLDVVSRFESSASYLKYHRGITHSLMGVAILGIALGLAAYYLGRRAAPKKGAPPVDARWLLACSLLATFSHLLLDFTNSYGIRPFLPFSGRWCAWDIMFIIDPLLLALLLAGFAAPALFRLISEEVGARKTDFRSGAIFALCSMVVLWGIRDVAHARVVAMLDSHLYQEENPRQVGAFPAPINPFAWTGVVETESAYHVLPANALAGDVDVEHTRVFRKPEPAPALDAAMKTRTSAIFLDFARFPWGSVDAREDGFDVTLRDLRFAGSSLSRGGFTVRVDLDKDLRVRSESFSFSGRGGGQGSDDGAEPRSSAGGGAVARAPIRR
ncbi:MAG: metal-dependent hydrolase [Terriglobia bacterium]